MRTCFGRTLGWAVGVAWLAGPALHAGPLKDPKRFVDGHTVDLAPLFHWWTNHSGPRPLRAWVHVRGPIVGTNVWGWTVEAQLDSSPARAKVSAPEGATPGGRMRVVLKHPPLREQALFGDLAAQLKTLNDQHQALSTVVSNAASRLHQIKAVAHRSRALNLEAREVELAESQAKAQLGPVEHQLRDCRAKLAAYPNPASYSVDCLALDTGEELRTVPVFDYGVP